MIYGFLLILLSLIAVPSLILSKKPDAKELLDKIVPYQGWIGVVFCLIGIWGIITAFLNMGWLTLVPVWWFTLLAGSFVQATLGFILGYGVISKKLLGNSPEAKEKASQLLGKLAPLQGKLGIVGIGVGVWMVIASLMFRVAT